MYRYKHVQGWWKQKFIDRAISLLFIMTNYLCTLRPTGWNFSGRIIDL